MAGEILYQSGCGSSMILSGILPYARELLARAVNEGDIAVDGTAGNGHDTLFLATRTGDKGHVYSFDIQEAAIANTKKRLEEHGMEKYVTLIRQSHDKLTQCIPAAEHQKVTGAIFNLGYLPGSDKSIVTEPASTIEAVRQLLAFMPKQGIIVLVIYHGHEKGKIERDEVVSYTSSLDPKDVHVLRYEFTNQTNDPPFIIALEKR